MGRVEIVLTDTDEGLGMVLETTGGNLRETKAIAKILKDEYGGRKTSFMGGYFATMPEK